MSSFVPAYTGCEKKVLFHDRVQTDMEIARSSVAYVE